MISPLKVALISVYLTNISRLRWPGSPQQCFAKKKSFFANLLATETKKTKIFTFFNIFDKKRIFLDAFDNNPLRLHFFKDRPNIKVFSQV